LSTQQPAGAVQTIVTGKLTDAVLGGDNKTVLVGTAEGWVTAFDIATGDLVNRWKVGTNLGGMDVSPDGRYLVATEQFAPPGGGGTGQAYHTTVTVHVLDTTTGVVRDYSTEVYGGESVFGDAAYLSDGTILLSGTAYSDWVPVTVLNPTTGTFTRGARDPLNSLTGSTFVSTADGAVVVTQSGYKVYTYSARDGLKLVKDNTPNDNGYGAGYAVSPDGDMLLRGSYLYKDGLKTAVDLYRVQPEAWNPNGWAFSPDGKHAYMLSVREGRVLQMSTADWSIERVLPIGFEIADSSGSYGKAYGDRLTVTPDGKYLVVLDDSVLTTINLQTVVPLGASDKDERFIGGDGADTFYAYGGADILDGGAGDDTLWGGAGNDVFIGSLGYDHLNGGSGSDTVDYTNATIGIEVRLDQSYGRHNPTGFADVVSGIENVIGGVHNDMISGTREANRLEGGAGNDLLTGGGGQDVLLGGDGDDILYAADGVDAVDGSPSDAGKDIVDGGAGMDVVSYAGSYVAVTVDLSTRVGPGGDQYISIEGVEGSDYADTLTGDALANVLWGGKGDDKIDGGAGDDTARYEAFSWNYKVTTSGGVTTVEDLRPSYSYRFEGKDTLTSIEHIVFGPSASESALRTELFYLLRAGAAFTAEQQALLGQWTSGAINADQMIAKVFKMAAATTSVATLNYQFFTGKIPSDYGVDYLISTTGGNSNNLNSAYYAKFDTVNRYINFAVNLGKDGDGKKSFTAAYGDLSLFDATKKAYAAIFGGMPTDAKVHSLIDTRVDYLAYYGGDGPNGIGTKAAMVGFLLAAAATEDVGVMAKSNDAWLADLADGSAPFAVNILDPANGYYKADFIFGG